MMKAATQLININPIFSTLIRFSFVMLTKYCLLPMQFIAYNCFEKKQKFATLFLSNK